MGYQSTFKRHEVKFMLNDKQYNALLEIMKEHMHVDKFTDTYINNLYYDNDSFQLIRTSMEKPLYKEKLRVRSYGVANDNSKVYAEIKKKYNGIVYKRRIDLPFVKGEILTNLENQSSKQIAREINYFKNSYGNLRPRVFIAYHRDAYYGLDDSNFRMTFDTDITYRDYDLDLSAGVYGKKLLKENQILMEVKTSMGFPRWFLDFFNEYGIKKTSFSKYGQVYEKYLFKKAIGTFTYSPQINRNSSTIGGLSYVS